MERPLLKAGCVIMSTDACEIEALRKELKLLEGEVSEHEEKAESLRNELHLFERDYNNVILERYLELDAIEKRIVALTENRDMPTEEAHTVKDDINVTIEASFPASGIQSSNQVTEKHIDVSDLKNVFRGVARRVHPDFAVSEEDRDWRHRLMQRANQAYDEGDEATLRSMLNAFELASQEASDQASPELLAVLTRRSYAKMRIEQLNLEIDRIQDTEMCKLYSKVKQAKRYGRDLLEEMTSTLSKKIADRRTFLHQEEARYGR